MARITLNFRASNFAIVPRRWSATAFLVVALVALSAAPASAQFFGGQLPNGGNNSVPIIPQMAPAPGNNNLTPQQLQSLMMMRAMSGRGRHGVQSGFPQIIPFGGSGFGGAPVQPMAPNVTQSASHKNSTQKRAEARKLRENQKHAVRQDEKAKKTKPAKKVRDDKHQQAAK